MRRLKDITSDGLPSELRAKLMVSRAALQAPRESLLASQRKLQKVIDPVAGPPAETKSSP